MEKNLIGEQRENGVYKFMVVVKIIGNLGGDFAKIMKEKPEILQPILIIRGKVGQKSIKIKYLNVN